MKKLIILLLIVGCEEFAPTNHTHTDTGETVTDTLFVYDTLIVTNYDTLIVLDTLIVNYDTTITVIDTVFMVENSEYIDVDWFLMKGTAIQKRIPSFDEMGNPTDCEYVYDNGYYFIFSESSNITNINLEYEVNENGGCGNETLIFNDNTQTLSFTYNGESFNFDLSDSFDSESEIFFIETNNPSDSMFPLKRILYNQNMNYIKLFSHNGLAFVDIDCSAPNEIIDYR